MDFELTEEQEKFLFLHDMQRYSRRTKAAELLWGDTNFHRKIVLQELDL
jgi:hypothetical protein